MYTKSVIFLLIMVTWLSPLSVAAFDYALIVDHKCIKVDKIPDKWILKAKQRFHIAYGHTSHGSQIVSGMKVLAQNNPLYSFSISGENDSLKFHDRAFSRSRHDLGHNGDTRWADLTRAYLNQPEHSDVNLVMWSWCGGVSDNTEEGINAYLQAMNRLEEEYPNIIFVYMTGHLDGTGEDGNLHQRNEQIRRYCRENNKVLFDFADIESYDPDGNYFLDKGANDGCNYAGGNWAKEWCDAHPGQCSSVSCAHSHSLNCNMKGRAFWWMLARLAGWLPAPQVKLAVQGRFARLFWQAVDGALYYVLYYAPFPYQGPETIGSANLGNITEISATLPQGFAYYLALKSARGDDISEFSNIVLLEIN